MSTAIQEPTQAILERGKKYTSDERPTYVYNQVTRTIISPDGVVRTIKPMPLSSVLSHMEERMREKGISRVNLFLCVGSHVNNKPTRQYFDVDDSWTRDKFDFVDVIYAEYYRRGFKVYLYGTSKWFDEATDAVTLRNAYYEMQSQLGDKFHYPNFKQYITPASTGRNLLRVSLPEGVQYETLPDETLRVIYRFCCYQGRYEHFPPKRPVLPDGAWAIDETWSYSSKLYHLPTGPCIHDSVNKLATRSNGYRCNGFYYCTVTIPYEYHHIGLLKEYKERYRKGDEAIYPNVPGYTFKCWCGASELWLAIENGWKITIHERYYFPEELPDPFASWLRKFMDLRKQASTGNTKDKLLKAAYRNIVLHTIGSFKQSYTWKDHTDIPIEQFRELERTGGYIKRFPRSKPGVISCREYDVPLLLDRQPYVHPEWAATVWERTRAGIAEYILEHIPYDDVVSIRSDCLWSAILPEGTREKQEYDKPGTFVVKDYVHGPWEVPTDSGKMKRFVEERNEMNNRPKEPENPDSFYSDEEE